MFEIEYFVIFFLTYLLIGMLKKQLFLLVIDCCVLLGFVLVRLYDNG